MKRMFLICLLFLMTGYGMAQDGTFFEDLTFKEALLKAGKVGKPVFIDCYTKTCGPCKYMVKNIFPLKACGDYFNSNYVCIMKDMEEGDGLDIAQKYHVSIYPTYLILNADGTEYCRVISGVQSPEEDFVKKVKDAILLSQLNKRYQSGEQSKEFIERYTELLVDNDGNQLQEVMGRLWPGLGVGELSRTKYWQLIQTRLNKTDNPLFRYILMNRKAFSENLGRESVESKLLNTYADEFRVYKLMGLDYEKRMAGLELLEKDGCLEAYPLHYSMLIRDIIDGNKKDRVNEIVTLTDKKLSELSTPAGQMQVIGELGEIRRVASPEQVRVICKNLIRLSKKADAVVADSINRLITRLSKN